MDYLLPSFFILVLMKCDRETEVLDLCLEDTLQMEREEGALASTGSELKDWRGQKQISAANGAPSLLVDAGAALVSEAGDLINEALRTC